MLDEENLHISEFHFRRLIMTAGFQVLRKAARSNRAYQTLQIRTEPWENLQLQQHLSRQATMHVGWAVKGRKEE